MSELSDLVANLAPLRLRQSRAIARLIDKHNTVLRARDPAMPQTEADEDAGYGFIIGLLAVALERTPAEVEDLGGTISELPDLVPRVMAAAGFAPGEAKPATSLSIEDSSGSMPRSPPAMPGPLPPPSGK